MCELLPDLPNGEYVIPHGQPRVGVTLITTCKHGYHLSSTVNVMCANKDDGNAALWSPDPSTCGKTLIEPYQQQTAGQ